RIIGTSRNQSGGPVFYLFKTYLKLNSKLDSKLPRMQSWKPDNRRLGPSCHAIGSAIRFDKLPKYRIFKWALNSAVECHPHTVEVIGSNPIAPTTHISPGDPDAAPATTAVSLHKNLRDEPQRRWEVQVLSRQATVFPPQGKEQGIFSREKKMLARPA